MIEVSDLHKSFDGQEVLTGVNFTVEKGDVFAVIGGSGQG
ncbi:MAG TPA: glutamine ABC transporter ATP-binding protein GlnQ, partial [Nitrospirota bacterium]